MQSKQIDQALLVHEVLSKGTPNPPIVSVIIPAFNEQHTITQSLDNVFCESTNKEIIIVDDGSRDETPAKIQLWIKNLKLNKQTHRVIWLTHKGNMGKGRAVRAGIGAATGTFIIPFDADQEVFAKSFPDLLGPLLSGRADFVVGVRSTDTGHARRFHQIGIYLLNYVFSIFYQYRLRDSACCFKITTRKNYGLMQLEEDGFEFCPEVIAKASKLNLRLEEVEIDYQPRTVAEGKKFRLLIDGLKLLATAIRYRNWTAAHKQDEALTPTSQSRAVDLGDERQGDVFFLDAN